MKVLVIFMWLGYFIFTLFAIFLIVYLCFQYFKQRSERLEKFSVMAHHSTPERQSSYFHIPDLESSLSEEDFQYYKPQKIPEFKIPEGVTDGLSDFEYSIMCDQPMVLTHPNPFCKQSALGRVYSSSDLTTTTSTSDAKKIKSWEERPRRHSTHHCKKTKVEEILESPEQDDDDNNKPKRTKAVPIIKRPVYRQ